MTASFTRIGTPPAAVVMLGSNCGPIAIPLASCARLPYSADGVL
jgi:hypothetical protein